METIREKGGFDVMIKVGEAFGKLLRQFLNEIKREKGSFDVMIKVGEAFEKVVRQFLDEVDARERWL